MRITFITSGTGISGGTKAIFEFANYLVERGHRVYILCSLTPFIFEGKWFNPGNFLTKILRIFKKSKGCGVPVNWFNLKANLLPVPSLAEKYIPEADVILATWWETAYFVNKYSKNKGEKFYLVQDYEIWAGPEKEVKASYKLGLKNIVNSTWLKDILQNEVGAKVKAVILHAPDHEQIYPEGIEREKDKIRILIPYRKEERKGTKEGLEIFQIVKKKYPNVKLVMFGPKPREGELGELEKEMEFHLLPVKDKLRKIYNSCDIFCFPSLMEGFGMPPMEAMACRIPVVTTNVGAIPEFTIPGKTALVSEPGNIEKMTQNIIELIENKSKRKEIAENGYQHINQFTWARATEQLEKIFQKYL